KNFKGNIDKKITVRLIGDALDGFEKPQATVDGRLFGTLVNIGNDQQVRACSGEPFAVQRQRAVIECGDRPIAQVTRIVYHEGKPV
ncbi:MAG: hypothetical protein ACMXYC_03520, partial [Candidatus Woesearchaeota archaeon]